MFFLQPTLWTGGTLHFAGHVRHGLVDGVGALAEALRGDRLR